MIYCSYAPEAIEAVLIPDNIIDSIYAYRQCSSDDPESGGLILGRVRGQFLEVTEVTFPSKLDYQSRFRFTRRDPSHHAVAMREWDRSGNEVGYLGEWHTHPELTPQPSAIDLASWRDIVGSKIPSCALFFIAGIENDFVGTAWVDKRESICMVMLKATSSDEV